VAVVGASGNPNKIGGRPIAFLKRAGYAGAVYPVNPGSPEIQGLRTYASVGDIPDAVDQAIIALPAPQVMAALEACIAKSIPVVQVFSAGFAEAGEAGRALQEQVRARAAQAGVRLLGPNTLGLFNVTDRFFGTFSIGLDGTWPLPGHIGIASQSGAFGSYVFALAAARGLGFSHFVATGNECDIDVAECIAYLAQDERTRVIVAALESCRDAERLMDALRMAQATRKPVIVMKAGVSEAGAAAAATHTGSLAGADAVYEAVFRQFNAHRARTIDELLDVASVCAQGVLPRDECTLILTTSGGIGVLMADAAAESGVSLPSLSETTRQRVHELWPYAAGDNPLDTTAQLIVDLPRLGGLLEAVLEEGAFSTVVSFLAHLGRVPAHFNQLREPLLALRRRFPAHILALCMLCDPPLQAELEREGFLVFTEPTRAMRAIGAAARLARGFGMSVAPKLDVTPTAVIERGAQLDELAANRVLAEAGIPMAPLRWAANVDEAVTAARDLGFPVALKIASPDVPHKSDVGGVLLNLATEAAVRAGFKQIGVNMRRALPHARWEGAVVAPMIRGGVECILGVQRDPVFGPVVMFGLGGIFVEVFRDVTFRVAPFSEAEARAMIDEIKGATLLYGYRGQPPGDLAALSRALAALSRFAYAHREAVESIDINPLIVLPDRVVGVDARIQTIG
jgi:acyl-CoA synthetase (NDP forming)